MSAWLRRSIVYSQNNWPIFKLLLFPSGVKPFDKEPNIRIRLEIAIPFGHGVFGLGPHGWRGRVPFQLIQLMAERAGHQVVIVDQLPVDWSRVPAGTPQSISRERPGRISERPEVW